MILDAGKSRKVIVEAAWQWSGKTKRRVSISSQTSRTYVTLAKAISATRNAIPPFMIMPGKQTMAIWMVCNFPAGTAIKVLESGYINDELAIKWINHFVR